MSKVLELEDFNKQYTPFSPSHHTDAFASPRKCIRRGKAMGSYQEALLGCFKLKNDKVARYYYYIWKSIDPPSIILTQMTITLNPPTIRTQLAQALGSNGRIYWQCLKSYLKAEIPRSEFEEGVRDIINTADLAHLHNSLITALLSSAGLVNPPPPPPDVSNNPRKRGSGSDRKLRLKRWAVGMGKRERERIKSLESFAALAEARARVDKDEIALGKVVRLLKEGRDPPGTHLPQHLCSITRTITPQNVAERIALIATQNDLNPPGKAVSQLILLALEAKLKHLVAHAISLSSTSRTVSSIQTSSSSHASGIGRTLSASSFDTLFTVVPAVMPYGSAATLRLSMGEIDRDWTEDVVEKTRPEDARAQMIAALRAKNNNR